MGHKLRIDLDLRLERPERLAEAVRIMVYKCVQELLTNVVKYASVDSADLLLRRDGSSLVLEVVDAGRGFDPTRLSFPRRTLGMALGCSASGSACAPSAAR